MMPVALRNWRAQMVYDWSGRKSRRILIAKVMAIAMVLAFIATAPILSPHI
jgi:hypothetical protein